MIELKRNKPYIKLEKGKYKAFSSMCVQADNEEPLLLWDVYEKLPPPKNPWDALWLHVCSVWFTEKQMTADYMEFIAKQFPRPAEQLLHLP